MGGKKKSLATKLAKMSDEERARYLQHRLEMEEEARKRKEHLISTFLKKKIKKEEDFTRLNIAKINQHWHQILRRAKCKEMKENVDHMKKWIERVMLYKNRTIEKLLEEIEEAEEQYGNNFKAHSMHIDNIIESQNQYNQNTQDECTNELDMLLNDNDFDIREIIMNAKEETDYLKTIIFRRETEASKELRTQFETSMQLCYETEYGYQSILRQLRSKLNTVTTLIWEALASTVGNYVKQSDKKRAHLTELKYLDSRSLEEIEDNNNRISNAQEQIDKLTETYNQLLKEGELEINSLELEIGVLNIEFLKVRKTLKTEQQNDDKKIKLLSSICYETKEFLENRNQKGDHIIHLSNTCRKFETEREIVSVYLPLACSELEEELMTESVPFGRQEGNQQYKEGTSQIGAQTNLVPKSAGSDKYIAAQTLINNTPTPELDRTVAIEDIIIQEKKLEELSQPSSSIQIASITSPLQHPTDILERCLNSLKPMENFWKVYNKVKVDHMEIKVEKKLLEKNNKQLKGMLRGILEALVLSKSQPNSNVPSRIPSRSRSSYSAPLKRIVIE